MIDNSAEYYSLGMRVRKLADGRIALMHNGALTWGTFSLLCVIMNGSVPSTVFTAIMNHLDKDIMGMQNGLNDIAFSLWNVSNDSLMNQSSALWKDIGGIKVVRITSLFLMKRK